MSRFRWVNTGGAFQAALCASWGAHLHVATRNKYFRIANRFAIAHDITCSRGRFFAKPRYRTLLNPNRCYPKATLHWRRRSLSYDARYADLFLLVCWRNRRDSASGLLCPDRSCRTSARSTAWFSRVIASCSGKGQALGGKNTHSNNLIIVSSAIPASSMHPAEPSHPGYIRSTRAVTKLPGCLGKHL